MPTSPSTSALDVETSKSVSGDVCSDPEVETREYTAPAPYVWETWQIEILNHYLPLYKTNKTVRQRTALLERSFRKMKAKRDIPDSEISSLRKASRYYIWFT
jgi:hypothetical protein